MKVYIWPDFGDKPDPGDGGVRRVVEAQRRYLPAFGWEVTKDPTEADLIAAHMTAPDSFYDARLMSKPLVAHNHGFYWSEYDWGGNWAERDNLLVMRLVKAADAVTAPSEWVAQIIRRHTLRDVEVLYHGIDGLEHVTGYGAYVLWNKTRVDAICDPAPVAEVARLLPDVKFATTFLPEGVTLPNVEVTGKVPYEKAKVIAEAAGVYLATSRETFGIGTLEAMAAGVPVVGYRTGGQAEIIDHLRNGYLAEPGDVRDLARGILWALKYREQLKPASQAVAARFLWRDRIAPYAELYNRVVAERQIERPKVSVVVPAYNLARYLPDTLRSVQTQTLGDFECIVVDDASPDDCGRIADEFAAADPRFKVVHNRENQYLSGARNTGIAASSGQYILPLDADDKIEPNTLEILSGALDADRLTWIAYGGVRFVNEDGETPTVYPGKADTPGHSGWPVPMSVELLVKGVGQPLPYASMYRRNVWRLTGGYRRRVRSSEDCDFWMRACSYGFDAKMVTTADTLVYRNRDGSMSRTSGWADSENKDWYPWREHFDLLPAGGQSGAGIKISAVDPPVVSVVIPVGPEHYEMVRDAVDSVDAQAFRRWECIVVDDTGARGLEPLPSWVRVVKGATPLKPVGVVEARNAGAAAAHPQSQGLVFLDADDFLMPEYLEVMTDIARRGGNADVLYADFWEDPERPGVFRPYKLPDYSCDYVLGKALHSVTAYYPMAAFKAVDGFTENVPWEDWDLQLKLAEAGVCARRVGAPLWAYRKHTGKRREDRYERREAGKADMLARWGDYIEGRKTLAGCASCGGGRVNTVYPNPGARALAAMPGDMPEAILLEDTSAVSGKKTYRGRGTGAIYHFQAGTPRWVDRRDAAYFLSMGSMRRHDSESAAIAIAEAPPADMQLTAPGPPVRDELMAVARQADAAGWGEERTGGPAQDFAAAVAANLTNAAGMPFLNDLPPEPVAPPSIRGDLPPLDLPPPPLASPGVADLDTPPPPGELERTPIDDSGEPVAAVAAPAAPKRSARGRPRKS